MCAAHKLHGTSSFFGCVALPLVQLCHTIHRLTFFISYSEQYSSNQLSQMEVKIVNLILIIFGCKILTIFLPKVSFVNF